jgi:DNA (cytosine-5)-methyltransferase 1
MLVNRGLDRVLGDLSEMGFDAKWGIMGADFVGAPHRRERIWIFAYPHGFRPIQREHKRDRISKQKDHPDQSNNGDRIWGEADRLLSLDKWSEFTSKLCGMDDGLASRVDRVKACGNGQVPEVAATAWRILSEQ